MTQYKKKIPDTIEAIQWFPGVVHPSLSFNKLRNQYYISLIDEVYYLEPGDWIIDGEYWQVCSNEEFVETYEKI